MATFHFTARRSLLPHHVADQLVTIDIDLTDTSPPRRVQKSVVRAASGRTETLFHRTATDWMIVFAPVRGHTVQELLEFLDSTASGETFLAWFYGTEGEPLTLRRSDAGYTLAPFMRVDSEADDWFSTSISAVTVP